MGGIPTNWRGQVINPSEKNQNEIVKGLWAAGEAASSSVHGANRLGANSLLDIVVFGKACSENISELCEPGEKIEECDSNKLNNDIESFLELKNRNGKFKVSEIRLELQKIMQKHAGVFRTEELLSEGGKRII